MKKVFLFLILITVIVFSFLFIGNKLQQNSDVKSEIMELKLDDVNKVDDFIEFKLVKIKTVSDLRSLYDSSSYFKTPNENMVFVDAVFDIRCINKTDIPCYSIMTMVAKSDKREYNNAMYVTENSDGVFEKNGYINFENYKRFHCAVAVDSDETQLEIKFDINGQIYNFDYELYENVENSLEIQKGDVINNDDYARFYLKDVTVADDVLPENISGKYTHYVIEDSNHTYVVVKYEITNNLNEPKSSFAGIKAISGKNEYYGFTVCENKSRNGFDGDLFVEPGSKSTMYCLIEMPEDETEDFVLEINFDTKTYYYNHE